MSFNPITNPLDFIVLAGQESPGIAEIVGAASPRNWEERKGYGYGGAIVVFRGVGLAKFSVKFILWTEEHWSEWEGFRLLLQRPPPPNRNSIMRQSIYGPRPRALDIYHPILLDLGVSSVVVTELVQPVQTGHGEWTHEVKFIEYRQPTFQLSRPEGTEENQLSEVDRQIQAQEAENAAMYRQLAGEVPD